ncbi:uncharacterized protein [Centruroides vittatus]|uniref:uncharacterized protein isoform X1 n=2 Tax=Centruroides TaxID=6875 RepID=UPI00350EB349
MAAPFTAFVVLCQVLIRMVSALDKRITVDCHNDPENIIVTIDTDIPFLGLAYVTSKYNDPRCVIHGHGNNTTKLKIPFLGCNTSKKDTGLFMNRITIQQHPLIVSSGDGEYEVGCKMYSGDIQIDSGNNMEVTAPSANISASTDSVSPPQVLLRVYDFENDVFVETVRLGQVVELEITIRDGNLYKGRVSDCDAFGENRTMFPVIRNYCPVDLSISDKVYVDDQSRTTGDFYLYIPFRVFRFLDGVRVAFTCNVVICQDDCPEADCGEFSGMSYGRKRRSISQPPLYTMTVRNEVTVVDSTGSIPYPPEEVKPTSSSLTDTKSRFSIPWLIGSAAVLTSFVISVTVNIYLLIAQRRHSRNASCDCHQMDIVEREHKEIELMYPSVPFKR